MKRTTIALALAGVAAAVGAAGAETPAVKGSYVEARTAEIFTGACIVNGEAGTTGREALMAWKVDQGSFKGIALDGLSVVVAVSGDVNLSIREIGGDVATAKAAVFVDERANPAQQVALVAMANKLSNGMVDTVVQLTRTPIAFVDDGQAIRVEAQSVKLAVTKELKHDPTCGAKQWFNPLSTTTKATLGTTLENAFSGSSLGTRWSDPNKRSSFFGTFAY